MTFSRWSPLRTTPTAWVTANAIYGKRVKAEPWRPGDMLFT